MKRFWLVLAFYVACAGFLPAAQASDDNEYWSTYTVSAKVNERVKLNLIEEFYLKHDMGNFYTYVQYAGASYKVNDYFDAACWYKLVLFKKNQHWSENHCFDIDGTLKLKLEEFKLSNRSRFERNMTASSWLYRDRIMAQRTVGVFNKDFTPYISNEFFIDIDPRSGYHENRAIIGISTGFIWNSELSVYYMSRAKKSNRNWNNANVLGTTLGISF